MAAQADGPTIPPGNETLIAELLGRGETLPGDCKLVSGSIERSFVAARYECAGAAAALELRHPSEGAGAAARTKQFAIVPRGAAPPALIDAIARRIGGAEARFQWIERPPPSDARSAGLVPQPPEIAPLRGTLALAGLAAVLAAPLAVVAAVLVGYLAQWRAAAAADRRRLASYLLLFLAVLGLGALRVVPQWGMQLDEERDFILSTLCADGKGCPLVGNEMNQLRIKLGPLNRYLMTLCQLVTPDPRFTLSAILTLHALGAAWLAATGDLLLGFPFGLVAGAVFGANPILLHTIGAASNGAWSPFFLVGTVAGTLRWVGGEPRALIVAVTCLAAAGQLHGTNLVLLPPLALVAVLYRPPVSARVVGLCALIVGALYSPWLAYQWRSRGSDFSLISTSWMMSEGPDPFERLGRIVPILGGFLATPLGITGMVALAAGRGWALPSLAVGRSVALLVGLPLGAIMLAGGGWVDRYGVPVVVPGALAAAAGMRVFASFLRRPLGERSARLALGALAFAWLAGVGLQTMLLRGWPLAPGPVQFKLGLAEQIEAIRALGEHGFGAVDLESRVHGASWNRWDGGHAYLGKWLIGTETSAGSSEHVVIVECEEIRPGFSSWQQSLASSSRRVPHLLVGYRAQLAPAKVEFGAPNGGLWMKQDALPFYGQMVHGGDALMRALFDPKLAYAPDFAELQKVWASRPPTTMKLSSTLAAGREDRTLTLIFDAGLRAAVTVNGVPRPSVAAAEPIDDCVRERFFIEAPERAGDAVIEAKIELPPNATVPQRVDLYEEPPCTVGAAEMRER